MSKAVPLFVLCLLISGCSHAPEEMRAQSAPATAQASADVGCIGHFATEDAVIRIAAPYYESRPSVIARLFVQEGDWVKPGQVIAWLDGKKQLEAERSRALAELSLSERKIAQVRAGAKPGDLAAQKAEVARLEASLALATSEYDRDQKLFQGRDISQAQLDRSRNVYATSAQSLKEAQHRLAAMNEVRPEDLAVSEADATVTKSRISELETRLAATIVTSPAAGRVIKVHAHTGEKAAEDGIVEIADTNRMAVEAEVYASDLAAVRAGQRATVQLENASGTKLQGEVLSIGSRVQKPAVLPNDPSAFTDKRVVPVRIRVTGCQEGACPIDGRVKVVIHTSR